MTFHLLTHPCFLFLFPFRFPRHETVQAAHTHLEQQLAESEAVISTLKAEMETAREAHDAALAEAVTRAETAEADAKAIRDELVQRTLVSVKAYGVVFHASWDDWSSMLCQ